MSNNTKLPSSEVLNFQLSVNLHYGAFNLLLQSFNLLSKLGLVSKSETERFHKFGQFYQNLLFRGSKKIYGEPSKPTDNEQSQS